MVSMFSGFSDMGMDDLGFFHHQLQGNPYEEVIIKPPLLPSYQTDNHSVLERPTKQIKMNNWNIPQDSSSKILSFGNSEPSNQLLPCFVIPKEESTLSPVPVTFPSDHMFVSQTPIQNQSYINPKNPNFVANKSVSNSDKMTQAKEHIIAERKRREILSQRFIALSALIPGLKKMDKASVLGDAIKYLKHLQEQVKKLEEETKSREVGSAVLMKRSLVFADDDHDDKDHILGQQTLCFPEIEARFSDKDVLIRIHCEKKQGILEKLIGKIENLDLMVINSSALAFGSSAVDVTIIAQMGDEFSNTAEHIVRHLHATLKHLI